MAIPFRVRIRMPGNSAPWMRGDDTTGGRLNYTFGALIDMRLEKVAQGVAAHLPVIRNPVDRSVVVWVPQADALAVLGSDRQIPRGLTESNASYGERLRVALDSWRFAGTARGVLMQVLGYLLAFTPQARFVSTKYDRSTFPPTRVSSRWDTYPAWRPLTSNPDTVYALAGGNGDWEWDDFNPISGSMGWWSAYVVIYAVAPQAWCHPAQDWGTGSLYTPSADGYYSNVVAGAYQLSGAYSGNSQAWGEGSTYTPSADGYYSTVSGGAYVASGSYLGVSQAWGVDVTTDVGQSIAIIVAQFKSASTWVRTIIVSFDATLFTPSKPAATGFNPDGTFGMWSATLGETYAESRFTNAVYGGEVV